MSTHTCGSAEGTVRPKDDQNFWNLAFSLLFAVMLALSVWYFKSKFGEVPRWMGIGDFLLIALAVYRTTRLVVYDKITQFLRDAVLHTREFVGQDGVTYVERTPYKSGPIRTISDLLACPWCTGMWATFFFVFFYYTVDFFWYFILVLALAGIGNFIQLLSNMVGWRAENLKIDAHGKESH